MGQDIHLVAEYKSKLDNSWHLVSEMPIEIESGIGRSGELFVWRDYSVFNTLVATARGDVENHIAEEPRGLPDDVTIYTRRQLEDSYGDLHSHSWISQEEFKRFFPWKSQPKQMSHFAMVGWTLIAHGNYGILRFVFAFDN